MGTAASPGMVRRHSSTEATARSDSAMHGGWSRELAEVLAPRPTNLYARLQQLDRALKILVVDLDRCQRDAQEQKRMKRALSMTIEMVQNQNTVLQQQIDAYVLASKQRSAWVPFDVAEVSGVTTVYP